jgi:hypothetical protein
VQNVSEIWCNTLSKFFILTVWMQNFRLFMTFTQEVHPNIDFWFLLEEFQIYLWYVSFIFSVSCCGWCST